MTVKFLGRVLFADALIEQGNIHAEVLRSGQGAVLGFESEPVITLGLRADISSDVLFSHAELVRSGFSVQHLDRGGQATVHNPGQLVLFPIWPVRAMGVRNWIASLAEISRQTLLTWNIDSQWDEKYPGLYTNKGKIMACGVRISRGISTHGIAINVSNCMADFALIRACGVSAAPVDRIGENENPRKVFEVWVENFRRAHC